jgi:hypothetical protein
VDQVSKHLLKLYDEDYYLTGKRGGWKQGYTEKALGRIHKELHTWIHKFFPGRRSMLIFGCALGLQVKTAHLCGDPAVGIDWNPLLGKHKLTKTIVRGSVTHLPFRSSTFQLGVNVNLMEHIPEDQLQQVIREQFRVCKEHFFIIDIGGGSEPTHVTLRPLEFWRQQLQSLADPQLQISEALKSRPPAWHIFILKNRDRGTRNVKA